MPRRFDTLAPTTVDLLAHLFDRDRRQMRRNVVDALERRQIREAEPALNRSSGEMARAQRRSAA